MNIDLCIVLTADCSEASSKFDVPILIYAKRGLCFKVISETSVILTSNAENMANGQLLHVPINVNILSLKQ
jgi:hypothetical protein